MCVILPGKKMHNNCLVIMTGQSIMFHLIADALIVSRTSLYYSLWVYLHLQQVCLDSTEVHIHIISELRQRNFANLIAIK